MIEAKEITKTYKMGLGTIRALDTVSLSVKAGEKIAIMGPSGSGKSTLLNIIGSLDQPTSGDILVSGIDIGKLKQDEGAYFRRSTIGFVFQFHNLLPYLTALENVELPMIADGAKKKERKRKAEHLLKSVSLEERMNHYPSELSGGERQRVAIARAFANNPKIILADEPTGQLDSKTGGEVVNLMLNLVEDLRGTLIISTHNPFIGEMLERKIHLHDGEII